MRPSKTIKYVAALSTNKVALESIKLWVEILGLIAVLLTLGCYVWLAFLQKDSNEINRQAMIANQRSLSLNQKSLELTQQSITLTQKSLDLTQQSVLAEQKGLKYEEQANDIAQRSLKASRMPSVGIQIENISLISRDEEFARWADPVYGRLAAMPNSDLNVRYLLTNHSDSSARNVWATCFFGKERSIDRNMGFPDNVAAILPKEPLAYSTDMMVQGRAAKVLAGINAGNIPVTIYLSYTDELGDRGGVLETFQDSQGEFAIVNVQYDPDKATLIKQFDEGFSQ